MIELRDKYYKPFHKEISMGYTITNEALPKQNGVVKILYEDNTEDVAYWNGKDFWVYDIEPKSIKAWKPCDVNGGIGQKITEEKLQMLSDKVDKVLKEDV